MTNDFIINYDVTYRMGREAGGMRHEVMTMEDAVFNSEMLEALLNMDEGPTLDFKQEQYPFEEEPAEVKSTVTTVATEVQLDPPNGSSMPRQT